MLLLLLLLYDCCTILALSIKSEKIDWFWCSSCLKDHINLLNWIGSFACGATTSLVPKKNIPLTLDRFWSKKYWNNYLDVNIPYGAKMSLAGLPVAVVFIFKNVHIWIFGELQGCNLEVNLINPISIIHTNFGTVVAILDFSKT